VENNPMEIPKPIDNPDEGKQPCCIVVDTSKNMRGYEQKLEDALKMMLETIEDDVIARGRVEICIIEFNDHAIVVSSFGSVMRTEIPHITTGGSAGMHEAISLADKMINDRKAYYRECGIAYYKPWIWLLTDGYSRDADNGLLDELKQIQTKAYFFPFVVGQDSNDSGVSQILCKPKKR